MKFLIRTAAIVACCLLPTIAFAGQKALLIIDMQDYFVNNRGNQAYGSNPQTILTIMEKQKHIIDLAKRNHVPIMIAEYSDSGPTNQQLLQYIGQYDQLVFITKNSDGLFDRYNKTAGVAKDVLQKWGVSDLIVMGANGAFCVEATIRGALASGYKVWAYTDGIADFNTPTFTYPYSYRRRLQDFTDVRALGFEQIDQPKHSPKSIANIFKPDAA